MDTRKRIKLYQLAAIIAEDSCHASALPIGEIVQSHRSGGMAHLEWAIDIRGLAPTESITVLDAYYCHGVKRQGWYRMARNFWREFQSVERRSRIEQERTLESRFDQIARNVGWYSSERDELFLSYVNG